MRTSRPFYFETNAILRALAQVVEVRSVLSDDPKQVHRQIILILIPLPKGLRNYVHKVNVQISC